jgi:ubiquinone/menaquinone biosynthesis C-methylase UbiE
MELKEIASIYATKLLEGNVKLTVTDNDYQWQYLVRYLPAEKDGYILDAGCGNGNYLRKVRSLGYRNILGVDLFSHHPEKGSYLQADIAHLPIKSASLDLIYSNSVIYNLPKPQKALEEFWRVLKPDGTVIITVHSKYSLFTLDRILTRFLKLKVADHIKDVRFYSSLEYKQMFDNVGLKLMEIDGFKISYLLWPLLRRLYKLLGIPPEKLTGNVSWFSNRWKKKDSTLRWIKSIICYHAVLVGCKAQATKSYGRMEA